MRAIFINAVDRKVEEVQIENTLQAFYDKIGCETIEIIRLGGRYVLIVDEEGRLRNWKVGFRMGAGEGIAGNGLIVCEKPNGDFTDCPVFYGLVAGSLTEFLDLEKNPLPPPEFDDEPETLTPEQILAKRKELGLSQAKFAAALGVSVKKVSAWEHGTSAPNEAEMMKIRNMVL